MPFSKGNQLGKANLGRKKESKKTIWLMESLQEHGYDYEGMLVKFLERAAKGDRLALEMAHLLVKLVPHMANAPKQDVGINQIETLVIQRFEPVKQPSIDTQIVSEPENNA
jgi:hypothetical protein